MAEKKQTLSTEPYKGVRDFYPEDMAAEKHLFSVMRRAAESFGYEEYGASILEPTELYASKTSDEIVNVYVPMIAFISPRSTPSVSIFNRSREVHCTSSGSASSNATTTLGRYMGSS